MKLIESRDRLGTIVAAVSGMPKTGKTYLALHASGPTGPVWYHEFDQGGLNRVLPSIPPELTVFAETYPLTSHTTPQEATDLWQTFRKEFKASVKEAALADGTVILDPASVIWDLMQMVLVDDNKKKGAMAYREANAQFAGIIGYARHPDHACNLILLHHMKEIWVEIESDAGKKSWQASGRYEPDWQKRTLSLVDVSIVTEKPHSKAAKIDFRLRFDQCGLDPNMEGVLLDPSGLTPSGTFASSAGPVPVTTMQMPADFQTIRELLNLPTEVAA